MFMEIFPYRFLTYLYNFCFSPFSFFCAVRRRFVWVYASIQFALIVLFAHIFYTLVSNVSSTIISKTHIPLSKHNKNNNNNYFFHHYSLQKSFNVPEKINKEQNLLYSSLGLKVLLTRGFGNRL
jgi:hypothetical protein